MIKKIVLNIAIVAVVVFILDFAIGRTLRFYYFKETSGLHFRTTCSMETAEADIMVFGSSRANHHYVPEVFEDSLKMSFYNTGRDGNGILFQKAILKSVLKRHTPNVIILDYYGGFEKGEDDYDKLSSLLPYYRTHREIRNIITLISPFEKIKLLSEIYPFNSQIITIAIGNLEANKKRKPDNKGYVALHGEWQANIHSIDSFASYEIDTVKLSAFREFISIAKKSGAKVIVIYSPIFLKFNGSQDLVTAKRICSLENIPFWDYSQDTRFQKNNHLFQDIGHLNHKGAKIFSKIVVDRIKNNLN